MDALTNAFTEYRLKPWAIERADFANVHFRRAGEVAYIADDFLGAGDRQKRGLEEAKNVMATMKANSALAKIRPGAPPTEDVPVWAIGEYRAPVVAAVLSN